MRIGGPSNPFHIAKAYAPVASSAAGNVAGPSRLIAAKVSGGVDFSAASAPSSPPVAGAYPMYAHPADRNAAATGIALGRRIDVAG